MANMLNKPRQIMGLASSRDIYQPIPALGERVVQVRGADFAPPQLGLDVVEVHGQLIFRRDQAAQARKVSS